MRDELLKQATRIVVKVGSSLIASRSTGLRPEQIERLAGEIAALRADGREVLVVSSGAIISGIKKLQLKEYPKSLPIKQAAAAVGQTLGKYRKQHAEVRFEGERWVEDDKSTAVETIGISGRANQQFDRQ